jgi:hypothetical protein
MLQPLALAVFSPLKHYFRRAVEKRLRIGVQRFPKAEFIETYSKIRPKALTQKNIKSGFRKAGLVPFDPKKALERLLTLEVTAPPAATPPPAAASEQHFSTPENQHEVQKLLEETGSALQNAVEKIGKAVIVFHARAVPAEKECQELVEETKKMQEAGSRKRKKVPGKGPQLVGEVLDFLKQQKEGGSRG